MSNAAPVVNKPVNPLLARYLLQLATHPLRTKAVTSGTLSFLQEILGSNLAGVSVARPSKDASAIAHILATARIDSKAVKMGAYGAFIAAPMSHYLVGTLQKMFAGKTSAAAKVAQILASNIFVAPIQTIVFLASMAVINGAKSLEEIKRTVKGGFMSVVRITWVVSPLTMVIAQNFIPVELWVLFFNFVTFALGTYFNTKIKLLRIAAAKKAEREAKEQTQKAQEQPSA